MLKNTDFIILHSEQEFTSNYYYTFIILLGSYISAIIYFLLNLSSTDLTVIFTSKIFYLITFFHLIVFILLFRRKHTIKGERFLYEIIDDYLFLFFQNILLGNKKSKEYFNNDFNVKFNTMFGKGCQK